MLPVVLLALASSTSAAVSTVLKAHSARAGHIPGWAARLPRAVASIVANPLFATALVFDVLAVLLQVTALHYGGLAVVQPLLSASLVISLGIQHAVDREPVTVRETGYALLLVVGLIAFLVVSGAVSPTDSTAIGRKWPGVGLAVIAALTVAWAFATTRSRSASAHARSLALAVAVVYATTAGLMKSVTHIQSQRGWGALALSWQLWTLVLVAALGLVLSQQAFALAPLTVSLPVIASLDPLFSVLIGVVVYGEALRSTPAAVVGELLGLAALLVAVARLSTVAAAEEDPTPTVTSG